MRKKRKTVDTGPEVPTGDDHIRVSKQGAQGKLAEELFGEDGEDAPTDSKGPEDINFDNEGREDDELDDFIGARVILHRSETEILGFGRVRRTSRWPTSTPSST